LLDREQSHRGGAHVGSTSRLTSLELVAFDMAGTTIQDRGEVVDAFLASFSRNGMDVSEEDIQPWRGAAKRAIFQHFAQRQYGATGKEAQPRMEAAYRDFHTILRERYARDGVAVVPGTEAAFAWLRSNGVKLALMTGFDREIAGILIGAAGWQDKVDAVVTSDDVSLGRPAPYLVFHAMEATGVQDVRRVAVVGDTANDLLSGVRAGAAGVIGVLTGSQGIGRLGMEGHTHIIASVADLPALVAAAFP
jgi:phosphonatase-like hydrolase